LTVDVVISAILYSCFKEWVIGLLKIYILVIINLHNVQLMYSSYFL